MRPQFRVIFTVSLGKSWLWAQSKAGIRSVAPFFIKAAAASEPELSTVLRQIGRHTGPQTHPDAKSRWKARMLDVSASGVQLLIKGSIAGLDLKEFFLLLSSTGLAYGVANWRE
jgi:hypothetical protein